MPHDIAQYMHRKGMILLNNTVPANFNQPIDNNDLMCTRVHMLEKPIRHVSSLEVIADDMARKLLVVAKPAGLPVHPCGRFRKNSMIYIIRSEFLSEYYKTNALPADHEEQMYLKTHDEYEVDQQWCSEEEATPDRIKKKCKKKGGQAEVKKGTDDDYYSNAALELFRKSMTFSSTNSLQNICESEHVFKRWNQVKLCHRLDRVTSGVLMLATDEESNAVFHKKLVDGNVRKFYLARVTGKFGNEPILLNKVLKQVDPRKGIWRACEIERVVGVDAKTLEEVCGTSTLSKLKEAQTAFEGISYDPVTDTSLVFCVPFTGRTHQLREHLRYLNHTIINDHDDDLDKEDEFSSEKMWLARYEAMQRYNGDENKTCEKLMEFQLQFHDQYWTRQQFQICLHALRYEILGQEKSKEHDGDYFASHSSTESWSIETKLLPEWVNARPSPLIREHVHYRCGLAELSDTDSTAMRIRELVQKYSGIMSLNKNL